MQNGAVKRRFIVRAIQPDRTLKLAQAQRRGLVLAVVPLTEPLPMDEPLVV